MSWEYTAKGEEVCAYSNLVSKSPSYLKDSLVAKDLSSLLYD